MFVLIFEKADSAEALARKMMERSAKTGTEYKIISIYKDGKSHICWFYENASRVVGVK